MKAFLGVIVVAVAGIAGLGFYLGWFHLGSVNGDGKSNVTLTVDRNKMNEDKKTAIADVKDVERKIKDTVQGTAEKTEDGTFVGVHEDKLTMKNKDGKEQTQTLAANARVTCDGKACTVADLKAGMKIRVTEDRHAALRIEALDKETAFASSHHDGKVVSITDKKLVMKNDQGGEEHSYTLTADSKVTCDGKACQSADLKPGMSLRVTTESAESAVAKRVEALDSHKDFEKSPKNGE